MTWWQRQWQHWRDGAALEEESGFGGPVCFKYAYMAHKEEVTHLLKAALLTLGAGEVDLDRVKLKYPEVFVKVLRDTQKFMEVDKSSVDKVYCRCTYTKKKRKER